MKQQDIIDSLLMQAKNNVQVARDLFAAGHYDWALFIWHLVIEKVLKALIYSQDQLPPYIHDLVKLAKIASLSIEAQDIAQFKAINEFNIDARYDDEKLEFYKKATQKFAQEWVAICEEKYQWLLKQI